jgi:hypothetical protein
VVTYNLLFVDCAVKAGRLAKTQVVFTAKQYQPARLADRQIVAPIGNHVSPEERGNQAQATGLFIAMSTNTILPALACEKGVSSEALG